MVDKPLSASSDEVNDVLSQYGIGQQIVAPRPGERVSEDAAQVLQSYGVKVKPAQIEPSYEETFKGNIEQQKAYDKLRKAAKPGKIPTEPEAVPTREEFQRGLQRGVGAQAVSGLPIVGPLINLATAAEGPAPAHGAPNTFGQRFYEQQQADRAFAMAHPWEATGANLLASMVGYGGAAKAIPAAFGLPSRLLGSSLGARLYGGGIGGAGFNALDAVLRGQDPIPAAEVGGATGALAPVLSSGARSLTGGVLNTLAPRPGALEGIPRSGIGILANGLEGLSPQEIAAAKAAIGPHGFLSDITPTMTNVAGAISDQPGAPSTAIQAAYRARAAGQGDRIEGALTKATGVPGNFNIVDYEKFLTESRKAASDPLYQQWRDTKVYPTPELKALIPRLEKSGAFDEAETLAGIKGIDLNRKFFTGGPQKAFPTTETWDLVKRGLDSKIETDLRAGNKTRAAALIGLKNEMIDEIEKTPAGQVWKKARSEFADRSALLDQLAAGRDTFLGSRSGLSVDELREELKHLHGPELMARITGMRKAVSEAMGDKTEAAAQVRNKLLAPNNQEKLRLMLQGNPGSADELLDTLHSERLLSDNLPQIIPNMNTGASGQLRAERRAMFAPPQLPEWGLDITKPGTYLPPSIRPHNVLQTIINERAGRIAPSLTDIMLTPQGPRMDALLSAIGAEQARTSRIARALVPWEKAASVAMSGPGQAEYRRRVEP